MMNQTETSELMTTRTAARRAGVGLRQIRRAISEGRLSAYDVGGWPRVRWREVLEWIESRRVDAK